MSARGDLLAIPDERLRNGEIAEAALVWMDFVGGAKRWWTGFGPLTHAGEDWQGVGDLIDVSDITTSYQLTADPVTFSLAATSEMVVLAKDAARRVRGRGVIVYSQFFEVRPSGFADPWQPIGSPSALFSGTMGQMTYAMDGPSRREIQLQCEGLFVRRNAPPRGLWTHSNQQAISPGDLGLSRVALYNEYETRWL